MWFMTNMAAIVALSDFSSLPKSRSVALCSEAFTLVWWNNYPFWSGGNNTCGGHTGCHLALKIATLL